MGRLLIAVPFTIKDEDGDPLTVAAPDLRDAHAGEESQLVDRGPTYFHLEHNLRERVDTEINFPLAADAFLVLNVETRVWLEAALQVFATKCRRADTANRDTQVCGDDI